MCSLNKCDALLNSPELLHMARICVPFVSYPLGSMAIKLHGRVLPCVVSLRKNETLNLILKWFTVAHAGLTQRQQSMNTCQPLWVWRGQETRNCFQWKNRRKGEGLGGKWGLGGEGGADGIVIVISQMQLHGLGSLLPLPSFYSPCLWGVLCPVFPACRIIRIFLKL